MPSKLLEKIIADHGHSGRLGQKSTRNLLQFLRELDTRIEVLEDVRRDAGR